MLYDNVKCSVEECDRGATTRGWCSMHYKRWLKYGDPITLKVDRIIVPGQRFGFLVVQSLHSPNKLTIWNTLCDCGKSSIARVSYLKSGRVQSCGCRTGITDELYGPAKVMWQCCAQCNYAKGTMSGEEFIALARRIVKFN